MSKYININGEQFQVIKPRKNKPTLENPYFMRTLLDCYEKPSHRKRGIYNAWYEWYRTDDRLSEFGITSYNTYSFSLRCVFHDEEQNVHGLVSITPANNIIYVV